MRPKVKTGLKDKFLKMTLAPWLDYRRPRTWFEWQSNTIWLQSGCSACEQRARPFLSFSFLFFIIFFYFIFISVPVCLSFISFVDDGRRRRRQRRCLFPSFSRFLCLLLPRGTSIFFIVSVSGCVWVCSSYENNVNPMGLDRLFEVLMARSIGSNRIQFSLKIWNWISLCSKYWNHQSSICCWMTSFRFSLWNWNENSLLKSIKFFFKLNIY